MYISVVGGGRLGYYLTKALLAEGHEALIIERDASISQIICLFHSSAVHLLEKDKV